MQTICLSVTNYIYHIIEALRDVRKVNILQGKPKEDEGLPSEAVYADDADFISSSKRYLQDLEGKSLKQSNHMS